MPTYQYLVEGTGRQNAPFKTTGRVETTHPGDFPLVPTDVLKKSFKQLTEGRAEYGNLGTCQGPYTIRKLVIEREED